MVKASEGTATAKVHRIRARQEELPTIEPSDRRIAELEDLGDELADLDDELSAIKNKVKDCNENIVAAMKRRDRTYYNRPTWGSITLKETNTTAKVKKATTGSKNGDEPQEEAQSDE
jgi:predicted  nucleic acid-binding Zn-ribbon protein